jgi:hypothetical protein
MAGNQTVFYEMRRPIAPALCSGRRAGAAVWRLESAAKSLFWHTNCKLTGVLADGLGI